MGGRSRRRQQVHYPRFQHPTRSGRGKHPRAPRQSWPYKAPIKPIATRTMGRAGHPRAAACKYLGLPAGAGGSTRLIHRVCTDPSERAPPSSPTAPPAPPTPQRRRPATPGRHPPDPGFGPAGPSGPSGTRWRRNVAPPSYGPYEPLRPPRPPPAPSPRKFTNFPPTRPTALQSAHFCCHRRANRRVGERPQPPGRPWPGRKGNGAG